ncbi:hypothetical protein TSUD_221610 [Trifolium subterraneum]|uniref:Uncharacterized protein n=1 Tax=Trifolium subterraneum TaxID=3900 RepID=A0A2Z6MVP3_TRISU|nr:hypothetical protein TSUD_221610 [Trifolium subterraneum]
MDVIDQNKEEDPPTAIEDSDNAIEDEVEDDDGEEDEENASENEEEEGEKDTVVDEDQFMFREGTNPLDFVLVNVSGVQLYQRLQQYEAQAYKKRKTPEEPCHREGTSSKKAREDDISSSICLADMMEYMDYAQGKRSKKAISVLHEVVRLESNLPESYHTLGLVYNALGDYEKEMGFYMIAAHLSPKDSSLWKRLFAWSIEQGDIGQANYCISKAIKADPEDSTLRSYRARLLAESQDYPKAAAAYEQVYQLHRENIDALKAAAKFYQKCGQVERSICILEDHLKSKPDEVNASVVDLLGAILMEMKAYDRALQYIEQSQVVGKELPLNLKVKAGICHVHLGNMEMAQVFFNDLKSENASKHVELITEVADSLMGLGHYNSALNYFKMLDGKTLETLQDDVEARISLASLLVEEGRENEAISLLSPPKDSDSGEAHSEKSNRWWVDVRIKLKLCNIFQTRGMLNDFVDVSFPLVHESLRVATPRRKSKSGKSGKSHRRLPKSVLVERASVREGPKTNSVFHGFRPPAPTSDLTQIQGFVENHPKWTTLDHPHQYPLAHRLYTEFPRRTQAIWCECLWELKLSNPCLLSNVIGHCYDVNSAYGRGLKAARAKKLLEKKASEKEKKKAEAEASGIDWLSDDSDDEPQIQNTESPLCNLHKDEEYHQLIIDLCNALASLQRYREALEIINLTAHTSLSAEKNKKLLSLGTQMAYNTTDPKQGFVCVKHNVLQHAQSVAAWNSYYKVISRLENRDTRHDKFLRNMQGKFVDCVPPILISAHQFTVCSHHQDAARKYLEAYKLMPENPLVNLCVGTALINLALGFRLQNKHQCVVQGLAFLYNNLKISGNSQESLFNIARAYHHVGLVTLAAIYYEKVIAMSVRDYPIPTLPNEKIDVIENHKPGYCNLRREAAYNLHLIYKRSGALDLARQVLKDHCSV